MPLRMHDRVFVTPATIKKEESSDGESDAFDSDEDELSSEEEGAADDLSTHTRQESLTELNLTKPYGGVIAGIKRCTIIAYCILLCYS